MPPYSGRKPQVMVPPQTNKCIPYKMTDDHASISFRMRANFRKGVAPPPSHNNHNNDNNGGLNFHDNKPKPSPNPYLPNNNRPKPSPNPYLPNNNRPSYP